MSDTRMSFEKILKHQSKRGLKCECGSRFFRITLYDGEGIMVECPQCEGYVSGTNLINVLQTEAENG